MFFADMVYMVALAKHSSNMTTLPYDGDLTNVTAPVINVAGSRF